MTEALEVELHGTVIGDLFAEGDHAVFTFRSAYWSSLDRPVLGRWFEDGRPDEVYRGPGTVPAFFANLEPEGSLARWLGRKNDLGPGPLELLGVVGDDLPGAVRLRRVEPVERALRSVVFAEPLRTPSFSLAGVQLKLPMSLDRDDRLTLPLPGDLAGWFLKVPTGGRYRGIALNEAATMHWAAGAGFLVAECQVRSEAPEVDVLGERTAGEPGLLVRRFDRTEEGPIHQEDLAQALWLDPGQKYPQSPGTRSFFDAASQPRQRGITTVEGMGRYAANLLGPSGVAEFLRRVIFVVASGNGDAHVKNWSLWYPDRKRPAWAPLYDQVSTVAWHDETLACPLYGTKNFAAVRLELFERLAVESGIDANVARELLADTATRLREVWPDATGAVPYPEDHRRRLVHHWSGVPLLRPFGPLAM